jgi:hypothetical protein
MTLALPKKTWTVFHTTYSGTIWEVFYDESLAKQRYDQLSGTGCGVTKRPAADGVHELTKSATDPNYFPGKPTADQVLVMRARIAAGCAWREVRDTPDQEPEVRRILRDCAKRLEELIEICQEKGI